MARKNKKAKDEPPDGASVDGAPSDDSASIHPPADDADAGLSLDQLTGAFAQMMAGDGDDPYSDAPAPAPATDDPAAELAAALQQAADDDQRDAACEISPLTILEAMLFVGDPENAPITPQWLAGLMRGVRPAEIDDAVRQLNERYLNENRPYEIVSAGEGYRLQLRNEYRGLRDKFFGRDKAVRLSPAAVEVLSVVAYHGSMNADDVTKIRGKPSGALLKQLLRRGLLRLESAEAVPKKKAKFAPTQRFLDLFGLAGLEDLPRMQDVERR